MGGAAGEGGTDARVLRLAPDWDPAQVCLTPAEGYLLSRIDGQTAWEELLHIGGLSAQEIDECLRRWVDDGMLVVTGSQAGPDARAEAEAPPPDPDAGDDELVDESLGLTAKLQRRILEFERGLDGSYFDALGVERSADAKEIKRAYFQLSREFHPDRYYGRELGHYKERLEGIFRKLVEAYELLSDPATRAEIERTMPPPSRRPARAKADEPSADGPRAGEATAGEAEATPSEQPPKRNDKWTRLDRLRKQFRIPEKVLVERRFKAKQLYEAAMVSAKKERWLEAAASVRLAIVFDPTNRDFKTGFADVQAHVHKQRAEDLMKEANASWDDSSRQEALRLYEEALHYRPSDPEMNDRAAQLCLEVRELDRALEYARTASEVSPEVGDYQRTLGRVYRAQGLRKKAAAALEEALRLNPDDALAEENLGALRRGNTRTGGKR